MHHSLGVGPGVALGPRSLSYFQQHATSVLDARAKTQAKQCPVRSRAYRGGPRTCAQSQVQRQGELWTATEFAPDSDRRHGPMPLGRPKAVGDNRNVRTARRGIVAVASVVTLAGCGSSHNVSPRTTSRTSSRRHRGPIVPQWSGQSPYDIQTATPNLIRIRVRRCRTSRPSRRGCLSPSAGRRSTGADVVLVEPVHVGGSTWRTDVDVVSALSEDSGVGVAQGGTAETSTR